MRNGWQNLVGLLLVGTAIAVAQAAPQQVVDPFFLIRYDPSRVHFDQMPSLINSQCPQLHDHYVRAWVYGHLKAPDAEYFVVDGSVRLESGDRPGVFSTVQEEGYGFLVEVRGAKCLVDPTPYIFFPEATKERGLKSTIRISESVLDDISADLLRRYAKAFGGKKSFLRRVTQQQREELPPVLRQQLKLFEKNPNM